MIPGLFNLQVMLNLMRLQAQQNALELAKARADFEHGTQQELRDAIDRAAYGRDAIDVETREVQDAPRLEKE